MKPQTKTTVSTGRRGVLHQNEPAWAKGERSREYLLTEWGKVPLTQEALFEHLCLFVFQTGLTWETVLSYREALAELFFHYDLEKIVATDEDYYKRAIETQPIIRNPKKIDACRANAERLLAHDFDLAAFLTEEVPFPLLLEGSYLDLPRSTARSKIMAGTLKDIGLVYIGETAVCSLLQATGLIRLTTPPQNQE